MLMNLNDFTQYFDNPAVSVFNRSKSVSFPVKIGALYPAKWDLLSFGNSQKSNSAHSMRLAPLVAPSYTDLQLQNISAVVPLRTILKDYEVTFNYATNRDGSALPAFYVSEYIDVIRKMLQIGINPVGSLFDYLGYPVFADLYKSLNFDEFKGSFNGNNSRVVSVFSMMSQSDIVNFSSTNSGNAFNYRSTVYAIEDIKPFLTFIAEKTTGDIVSFFELLSLPDIFTVPSLDEVIEKSIYGTSKDAVNAYQLYIFSKALFVYLSDNNFSSDVRYSCLPIMAFWRFFYDWNVNGNFIDRDLMLEENVYDFKNTILSLDISKSSDVSHFKSLVTVPNRLWNDDFFTSALPTATVDNAVEIPANSTVLNLAKLTAWQKFVMRLSYSSRYRDVVWNIFKIKPSDSRLVQSYPIFRSYDTVGIGEVNQTSSSDVSGVLGGFAGRGYSSGHNKGYNIFCEEPCIVFDFVSLMPRAKYADAIHPLIHVDDILDFPIPDLDVLGNQPIYSDLVSGNPVDSDVVLGYGRQYQEWLYNYSTVHGDFKTTLDYWTISRRFSNTPVINDDFLRIHPSDDLDIIFSLQGESHAFLDIYYNAKVTRHVHRNVRIKI